MLCIAQNSLSVVAACVALVMLRNQLLASVRPALVVGAFVDAIWIYVLFREDTVRYFTRT